MYIEAVANPNSPPAILLRESYRRGGQVCKRTLCNLSHWPTAHIEGLRGVLKGGTVIPAGDRPECGGGQIALRNGRRAQRSATA
jgi:hypothetical protein